MANNDEREVETHFGYSLGRRDFLKVAGLGAVSLGGASLLSSCTTSSKTPAASDTTSTLKPKRGGIMRAGLTGGGSNDTLDPTMALTYPSYAAGALLYDGVSVLNRDAQPELQLATDISPNSDATVWTIRLRSGVTFHNGKDLTADDLIFTFQYLLDPKRAAGYAPMLAPVDVPNLKKLDSLTLQVPCKTPYSTMGEAMAIFDYFSVLPVGYDPKHPIGTGPFKLKSFTPGQELVVERNPNYWASGLPYLDGVVLTNYPDEASQTNALLGGQADVVTQLTVDSLVALQGGDIGVVISETGGWTPIIMRTDQPPFNDVNVRQAMRLLVDRQQMLDLVFGGHGLIGNDIFAPFDPAYNDAIPQRPHDPEQAISLLKKAGAENLTVELVTSPIASGTVKQATVFAQQAKAAGVTVNLKQVDPSVLYGPNWLSWGFTQDYWATCTYFTQVIQSPYPGMFDETHWDNPTYNKLFQQAMAITDPAQRTPIVHEMQQMEWDSGGYIIPYFYPIIDAHAKNVMGIYESKLALSLDFFHNFKTMWLA